MRLQAFDRGEHEFLAPGVGIPDCRGGWLQRHPFGFAAAALQHQQPPSVHPLRDAQVHVDVGRVEHAIDAEWRVRRVEQACGGVDRGAEAEQAAHV